VGWASKSGPTFGLFQAGIRTDGLFLETRVGFLADCSRGRRGAGGVGGFLVGEIDFLATPDDPDGDG